MLSSIKLTENERLKLEIQKEIHMENVLNSSISTLKKKLHQLQEELLDLEDGCDDEGLKWKTKYEKQVKINQQLENEIEQLQQRLDAEKFKRLGWSYCFATMGFDLNRDNLSEAEWQRLAQQLETAHDRLVSELRETEWQIDREAKLRHEMNESKQSLKDHLRNSLLQKKHLQLEFPDDVSSTIFSSFQIMPPTHRILDPRKGPRRRTASVRLLPQLKYEDSGEINNCN